MTQYVVHETAVSLLSQWKEYTTKEGENNFYFTE